ncbi:hypothetical protein EMIHUDRAFT_201559 [Emiliania huxleyi CCMP1516]|uniref:Uncharacterized protein n=2 Tax=Emiliania huxleyi TaxID=2903 RepID=A0A0D3KI67_EMIH1|nr:hypothetical protein EMIHUDRAFT_201559 [Emiliania huxleyi CCMP1516]EOD35452.1 hypothetical protein EMIHUDRAFT_201559 [Emiliania huxleyi CCMP1516]|eukprot:XP_005787881.1 hypothetical protein EMIHUDRAFT_201559 [Emiliania huxleyi CCMP1516]
MPGTNARRSGPPKHQNSFAWVPASADKHNTLQDKVGKLDLRGGVCAKCYEVIEWKRRYGKYKPLKQPAKCLGCNQKAVHQAYHQLCPPCAGSRRAHASLESRLGALPERQRRTAQRQLAVGAVPVSLTARIERSHGPTAVADAGDVTALLDAAVRRALLSEAEADRLTDAIASGARSEEEVAAEWEWAARLALPTGGAAVDPRPSSE